jgi:hypothetical protein
MPRYTLRVVEAAGARGNSPASWRTQTRLRRVNSPRTFFRPPRRCSARDKGGKT